MYFFSTHEPCSLCLSAITWSGFDNFYYFFSYQDSRDKFQIPHDLKILEEVFQCPKGAYRKNNGYWDSYSLIQMIDKSVSDKKADWEKKIAELNASYKILSPRFTSIFVSGKMFSSNTFRSLAISCSSFIKDLNRVGPRLYQSESPNHSNIYSNTYK